MRMQPDLAVARLLIRVVIPHCQLLKEAQTMSSRTYKLQVWIVIGGCVVTFLFHRHLFRPWILESYEEGVLDIIANSYPNFLEGIIGSITLGSLGLWFKNGAGTWSPEHETATFFNWVTIVAALYVVTQELNWFTVTRVNVYDPYDVIASVIGLIAVNRVLNSVGLFAYREVAG